MSSTTISPSKISGTVTAPPSKSHFQRLCAAALLAGGSTTIYNYGMSNDDKAALQIIEALGATIVYNNDCINITGNDKQETINKKPLTINAGESGLALRMFVPVATLFANDIMFTGNGSLLQRPVSFFNEVLPQLGVAVNTANGFLPMSVKGNITPDSIEVDGALSSQFLTGLLFAFAASPKLEQTTIITVNNLNSKPYINLSLEVISAFGLNAPHNNNYTTFTFEPIAKKNRPHDISITTEGDWSNAAFLLVAAAIAAKESVVVKGLNIQSVQADEVITDILKTCGCRLDISVDSITVYNSLPSLQPFKFDATHSPDLFPPLVALAAYCKGSSVIKGVGRLKHKESNRAVTLQEEFAKMGVEIVLQDDIMIVNGTGSIKGAVVYSHNDHRIAMACAVAALHATAAITIEGADAVDKSYPSFYKDLDSLL